MKIILDQIPSNANGESLTKLYPSASVDGVTNHRQLYLLEGPSTPSNERGSGRRRPPIVLAGLDLPAPAAFTVERYRDGHFRLRANDSTNQIYAGLYYPYEVGYFLKHWKRPPTVPEFMAIAEALINRGIVAPSLLTCEQVSVLVGGAQ